MKKIGLICMALLVALAGLGVGFAAWTDTVTIDGTVNTGNVDIVVEDYSGSWVYKIDPHGIETVWGWVSNPPQPPAGAVDAFPNPHPLDMGPLDPVAYAVASSNGEDAVRVDFVNLFPLVPVSADFLLHYAGSIPVRVTMSEIAVDLPGAQVDIAYYESNEFGDRVAPVEIPLLQLHYCDYIVVVITITIPQVQDNMNQQGTVTGIIEVMQWNEVP